MKPELKLAKKAYNDAKKNIVRFREQRDSILMQIVESEVPSWGGIKISVTKL